MMDVVTAASAKATNKAINPQQAVNPLMQAASKQAALQRAANDQRQIEFTRQRRVYFLRKIQAFACFICITVVYVVLVMVLSSGDWAHRDYVAGTASNSSTLDLLGLLDATGFTTTEDLSPFTGYCYCTSASSASCADVGNGFGGLSILSLGLIVFELIALGLLLWEAAFYGRYGGSTALANLVTIFLLMSLATAALSLAAVYMLLTYSFCKGQAYVDLLVRPGTAVFIRLLEMVLLGVICVYAAARSGTIIKSRSVGKGTSSSRYHGGPRGLLLTMLLLLVPMTIHSTLSIDWLFYDPSVVEEVRYSLSGSNITAPYQDTITAPINGAVRRFGIRSTCQCTHPCVEEVSASTDDSVDIGPTLGAWWPAVFYQSKSRTEINDIVGASSSSSLYSFTSVTLGVPLTAADRTSSASWSTAATFSFDETLPVASHLKPGSIARDLYTSSASIVLEVGAALAGTTAVTSSDSTALDTATTIDTKASPFLELIGTMVAGAPSAVMGGVLGYAEFPVSSPFNVSTTSFASTSWRPHFMAIWVLLLLQAVVAFFTMIIVVMRVVDNTGKSIMISQVLGAVLIVLMMLTMVANFTVGPPSTEVTCPAYGTFDPAGVAAKEVTKWEEDQKAYGAHTVSDIVPVFTKTFEAHVASFLHASALLPAFLFLVLNGWYLKKEKLGYHDVDYVRRRYHSCWWEVLQDPRTMAIEERQMSQLDGDTSSDEGSSGEDND